MSLRKFEVGDRVSFVLTTHSFDKVHKERLVGNIQKFFDRGRFADVIVCIYPFLMGDAPIYKTLYEVPVDGLTAHHTKIEDLL